MKRRQAVESLRFHRRRRRPGGSATAAGLAEDEQANVLLIEAGDPIRSRGYESGPMVIEPGIGLALFYSLNRFEEVEHMALPALEMQPGYLFGLWEQGVALCGLGQGIQAFERAVVMARTPLFVGGGIGPGIRPCRPRRRLRSPAPGDRRPVGAGGICSPECVLSYLCGTGKRSSHTQGTVRCLIGRMRPSILRTTNWS